MPCFYPRTVWRNPRCLHKSGKPRIFFPLKYISNRNVIRRLRGEPISSDPYKPGIAFCSDTEEFQVPGCNPKCVGCQESYARQWAVRCWHESQRYDDNCFITLTFNDQFLPKHGLDHRYFQLFLKRFRRRFGKLRYYMAGEYGKEFFRPHFHACIFGFDFPDRKLYTVRGDVQLDTSDILSDIWSDPKTGESYGFSSVGDVTFASAAYVARYISKKISGAAAAVHYDGRHPEYVRMSLKPGIGKDWFLSYKDSVYPDDAVTLRDGGKCKPPRYYDKLYELTNPVMSASVKRVRKDRARNSPDNSPARLRDREVVKKAQFDQLKRSL